MENSDDLTLPKHVGVTIECQPVGGGVAILIPLVHRVVQTILVDELLYLAQGPAIKAWITTYTEHTEVLTPTRLS